MHKVALILLAVALSIYAPFVGESSCVEPSCCARMTACCGHCHCPMQTCSVGKPVKFDQQAPARMAALPARIEVALFALGSFHALAMEPEGQVVCSKPDSPPPEAAPSLQARLCVWLI